MTDWARGDVVCCTCGVVVEGHILDETPEWRNHGDESCAPGCGGGAAGGDRSRVGPADPRGRLGTYLAVSTFRGGGRGGPQDPNKRLCRGLAGREDPREASLTEGLQTVDELALALRLPTTGTIAVTAKELFTDLHEAKGGVRSDGRRAAAAAALYYGCKLENTGRELRHVSEMCQVDPKALNAAVSEYKAALTSRPYYPRLFATLQAGKLIDIFLNSLEAGGGLRAADRRLMWREAHQLDEALVDAMDCGRKPRTICSGILYLAAQRLGIHTLGKKEITEACNVCQQTLDKVVAQIRGAGVI